MVRRSDEVVDDVGYSETVARMPWSPAQIVALAIGVFLVVLGGVALARTGLGFGELAATHTSVAGLHHTTLLAMIEVVAGVVLIGAGTIAGAERGSMVFLGVVLLAFGLIVAIQPTSFHSSLGMHAANGWIYAVLGTVLLTSAMAAPVFFGADRRSSRVDIVER